MSAKPISTAISHINESAQVETTLICLCALESSPDGLVRRTINTHTYLPYPSPCFTASLRVPIYRLFTLTLLYIQLSSFIFFQVAQHFKNWGLRRLLYCNPVLHWENISYPFKAYKNTGYRHIISHFKSR